MKFLMMQRVKRYVPLARWEVAFAPIKILQKAGTGKTLKVYYRLIAHEGITCSA